MKCLSRCVLCFVLLLLPQQGLADETLYIPKGRVNLTALLAPPPVLGSQQQRQEVELLLKLQKERTEDQIAFARADMERTVFRFKDVLGENFTAEKLPLTAAFFAKAQQNADQILAPVKQYWNRPRPYASNLDIHPCVEKPDDASYPSGHSTFGTLSSILLANMAPEKQTQIYERAELYRLNREIGGAHYPSDVLGGRISGTVIAALFLQDPAFQTEFALAKAELRRVLGLTAR